MRLETEMRTNCLEISAFTDLLILFMKRAWHLTHDSYA